MSFIVYLSVTSCLIINMWIEGITEMNTILTF